MRKQEERDLNDEPGKTQAEKFREAAEENFCDPDETRWDERLRKVVKHKPQPEKPE